MVEIENEVWKEIEFNPDYLISNYGRVKSKARPVPTKWGFRLKGESLLGLRVNHNGYLTTTIIVNGKAKNFFVHRLVAYAFVGKPNNPNLEINHIDGDKQNNIPENLEWVTSSYNTQHSYDNNLQDTKTLSIRCSARRLTLDQIHYIKENWKKVNTSKRGSKMKFYNEMAKKFNVEYTTIYRTISGKINRFFD